MRRLNGGKIGVFHNTTPNSSSGVYSLKEMQAMQSAVVWPVFPQDASFSSVKVCSHFRTQLNDPRFIPNTGTGQTALSVSLAPNSANLLDNLDTTVSKWYTTSFNLNTSRVQIANNPGITLGTGDFTMEVWLYPTNVGAGVNQDLIDCRNSEPNVAPLLYYGADTKFHYYVNGVDNKIQSAANVLANNTWHHIALSRVSGNTRLYVNGTQVGSTFVDASNYITGGFCVGASFNGASQFVNAYLGEARVTIGVGRYSGTTLTVPTGPFPDY